MPAYFLNLPTFPKSCCQVSPLCFLNAPYGWLLLYSLCFLNALYTVSPHPSDGYCYMSAWLGCLWRSGVWSNTNLDTTVKESGDRLMLPPVDFD